jgi:NAD(P)-dependent dehydrogenase (short-subunit alcohol dehydrogenase family)
VSPRIAVIFGAGPGVGGALARCLLPTHSLLLLSRSLPSSLPSLELNLPSAELDSRVLACPSDGSPSSLQAALSAARDKWPDGKVDVGISNAGPALALAGFLDQKEETLRKNLDLFVCVGSLSTSDTVTTGRLMRQRRGF